MPEVDPSGANEADATILLIEDDAETAAIVEAYLVSAGLGFVAVTDGLEGLSAALVLAPDGLLERMERTRRAQALDRRDGAPVTLHRERQTGEDALAIDQDGAGPASALVAALLGAGQAQVIAEKVEHGNPGIVGHRNGAAVTEMDIAPLAIKRIAARRDDRRWLNSAPAFWCRDGSASRIERESTRIALRSAK